MLKRLVESWRHHSHSYYLVSTLVLALLFLQCNGANNKCGPGIDTPGATVPEGDIVLENGSSLEIFCNLDLNHKDARGRNASDLVFYRNEVQVEREFIEVLNATTIRLFKKDPPASNDYYYCKLRVPSNYTGVCLNTVAIGYKPQEVLNFTCISHNWMNLTCMWTKPENPIKTKYTLRFHLPGRAGARMMFHCTNSDKENELKKTLRKNQDLCFWDQSTNPHYRQPYEYYYFSMYGENQLEQIAFPSMKFHHYSHVIPSPPGNLSLISKTTNSVELTWEVPFPMQNFPPGVLQRLEYQSTWEHPDVWLEADTSLLNTQSTQLHKPRYTYTLTGLKYPFTIYDIRVFMKSSVAVGSDKWSKPATLTVRTDSTIPAAAPRTNIGSFEVLGGVPTRDVYVYWQQIAQHLHNGPGFRYKVISVKENGVERDGMEPSEITNAYARFRCLNFNSYLFTIVAANDIGFSEKQSVVYVPSKTDIPPEPLSFTKIAYGLGLYELSWKPPLGDEEIESYTIFWCSNDRDRPYQCKGFLNWTDVSKDNLMINITVPEDTTYQFAISANSKNASSGMVWASCTVIHNKVVGKMKSVWINRIGSTFIEVGWKLECSDRIGRVQGFVIKYCPIVSPYNLSCKEPVKTQVLDIKPTQIHSNVSGLRPYTTYMVSIAILTNSGPSQQSDPLYNTTLEAAPDAPRNLIVSNVTNTSMIVHWLSPASTNGVIRYYEVSYDGCTVIVDRNLTVLTGDGWLQIENLTSYMNYSIAVSACTTECSVKSEIWVHTGIGSPGKMERPVVRFINSSQVLVSWKPPVTRGGNLNYYQVAVQQTDGVKNSSSHYYNMTGSESQIPIPDCDTDGSHQKYIFMVRAVNLGNYNHAYFGPWSDVGEGNCYSSGPSVYVVTAIWICVFVVIVALFIVFAYASKRVWIRCKEMKDLEVKLPPGLAPVCINEKEKDQDFPIDLAWPSDVHDHLTGNKVRSNTSADEELLLQKKEDRHGRNPSGDSSGCSSGHESVSSSLTSGTQISSDSGTEVDQRSPSPDGVFGDTPWDQTSLRQRNVGALRPEGDAYVKMNKSSGSIARSTPNLTDLDGMSSAATGFGYSCLGAWSSTGYISMPSSEEMGSTGGGEGTGYCRVGLDVLPEQETMPPQQQQQQQQAQSSPVKGYVILPNVMDSSPSNPSPQCQQPGPIPQAQPRGYVSHHLPWSSPVPTTKENTTGKGYVMAGKLDNIGINKNVPTPLSMIDVGEEDHDILHLELIERENQSPESYCRFGLRPIQPTEVTSDAERSVSKPNSGYVTLADGPCPPDGPNPRRANAGHSGERTIGASGGYVPHRHFEKRDTIPLTSSVFPDCMDESYSLSVSTSAGDNNVNSPTTNV